MVHFNRHFQWAFSVEFVLHHRQLVPANHHGSARRPGLVSQAQEDATEAFELHRLGFDSCPEPGLPTSAVHGHGQTGLEVDPRLRGLPVGQVRGDQPDRELQLVGDEREELLQP